LSDSNQAKKDVGYATPMCSNVPSYYNDRNCLYCSCYFGLDDRCSNQHIVIDLTGATHRSYWQPHHILVITIRNRNRQRLV